MNTNAGEVHEIFVLSFFIFYFFWPFVFPTFHSIMIFLDILVSRYYNFFFPFWIAFFGFFHLPMGEHSGGQIIGGGEEPHLNPAILQCPPFWSSSFCIEHMDDEKHGINHLLFYKPKMLLEKNWMKSWFSREYWKVPVEMRENVEMDIKIIEQAPSIWVFARESGIDASFGFCFVERHKEARVTLELWLSVVLGN